MNIPSDRKYTSHDEWVIIDGDVITIGLTDFAQDALGELVYVEMPDVGDEVEAEGTLCEVESVKAVSPVYAPAACEVVEVNEEIDGNEGAVNSDPYGAWLVKIRVTDLAALPELMDAEAYTARVSEA